MTLTFTKYGVAIGIEEYSDDVYAKITAYVDKTVVTEGKKLIVTHEFENPLGIIDFYPHQNKVLREKMKQKNQN